eukprot:TRINITY_DN32375_c0_g1_i1.p1 TRINITY_DN32375_c0_g1~~TRINITY_DN32375_c0_g1_i1.p1  ORF type:complete len:177 (-),score=18.28 TRINITY_DN32375_c0_g1_i1:483-1013(-)
MSARDNIKSVSVDDRLKLVDAVNDLSTLIKYLVEVDLSSQNGNSVNAAAPVAAIQPTNASDALLIDLEQPNNKEITGTGTQTSDDTVLDPRRAYAELKASGALAGAGPWVAIHDGQLVASDDSAWGVAFWAPPDAYIVHLPDDREFVAPSGDFNDASSDFHLADGQFTTAMSDRLG